MKKLIAMLCMLTCILGLSACGQEASKEAVDFQNNKATAAENLAVDMVVPYMIRQYYGAEDSVQAQAAALHQECYDVYELESVTEDNLNAVLYLITTNYTDMSYGVDSIDVEGNAVLNGIVSFSSAYSSLGEIDTTTRWKADSKVSGDTIIVTVYLTGSQKDDNGNLRTAKAEVIFSNDIFLTLESCTLNVDQGMGELMSRAAMDTLMGMATVFCVLILISILIWLLGFIPKLQEKLSTKNKKETKQTIKEEAVNNTIAQIVEKEESAGVAATDDLELVAVIAAAIAASQGAVSTDGFVVRSIRKRR
ncbi:MAG: lipoprotein [Lachnospiraceae bacterium]